MTSTGYTVIRVDNRGVVSIAPYGPLAIIEAVAGEDRGSFHTIAGLAAVVVPTWTPPELFTKLLAVMYEYAATLEPRGSGPDSSGVKKADTTDEATP